MPAKRSATPPKIWSDLAKVDAHVIQPEEYDEIPEMTDEMFARAVRKRAGRPIAMDPRRQVTIRLPESVLELWKATGPGWQTRMADIIEKSSPKAR